MIFVQEKVIDPFVIYKEKIRYTSLRDLISSTLFGRQMEGLNEAAQVRLARLFAYFWEHTFVESK